MKVQNVKKIAVLRANAVGDFIVALPALEAIRYAYPEAELVLLARPWHQEFLRHRPGPVDRVIPVPLTRGIHEGHGTMDAPGVLDRFFGEMRAERFDIAVQMHGGGRHSNPFVQRLGARTTVGLKTPDAPPLDRWIPYVYFQHEVLRYLEVVSLIGAKPVTFKPRISVTAHDIAEADRMIVSNGKPIAVLNPGAGDPRRRWPMEYFAKVAEALERQGAQVVVNAAGYERELRSAIQQHMPRSVQVVPENFTLSGLLGLVARSNLVVTNDTGTLHISRALGVPTVGIMWCGNVICYGSVSCQDEVTHISWRLECPVCGRNCIHDRCDHDHSFVADVPVGEVLQSALELWKQKARSTDQTELHRRHTALAA